VEVWGLYHLVPGVDSADSVGRTCGGFPLRVGEERVLELKPSLMPGSMNDAQAWAEQHHDAPSGSRSVPASRCRAADDASDADLGADGLLVVGLMSIQAGLSRGEGQSRYGSYPGSDCVEERGHVGPRARVVNAPTAAATPGRSLTTAMPEPVKIIETRSFLVVLLNGRFQCRSVDPDRVGQCRWSWWSVESLWVTGVRGGQNFCA
jgi:hypothetical protein